MTPPRPRRRSAGGPSAPRPRKLGSARRSQLVTTYGVGAMIAIENESYIVTGLDSWNIDAAPVILEHRLANVLKVKSFRLPPAPDPDRGIDGVRIRRFPEFYSCPSCGRLQRYADFGPHDGRARCQVCVEDLVPSRFVLVCDDGHIEDFPYWKWLHRGRGLAGFCGGKLSLRAEGASASLRSVVVSCTCDVPPVSMEGAFRVKALMDLGIRCSGARPWLRGAQALPCSRHPRAMQRGSSSAWNPVMRSALSIPPWSQGIHRLLERERLVGAPEAAIEWHFKERTHLLTRIDVTLDDVIAFVRDVEERKEAAAAAPTDAHARLRKEEYDRLCHGNPERHTSDEQLFVCERPDGDLAPLRDLGLGDSMLVKRLREVRALEGFTRGVVPLEAEPDQRLAELHLSPEIDWLPAIEVNGEGVFIRLDEDRLTHWESIPEVVDRVDEMKNNHLELLHQRASSDAKKKLLTSPVTPRYVLLHTLAHVLINEWSLDGGYPSSALRERLYARDSMAGILIYTATSDSAGSLGGIVAQGDPERLASTMRSGLARTSWCSNDPLCMESKASGVNSVNMAACHACVLLPETSCELANSFLDRAMLIGTQDGKVAGYFQSF